MVTYKELYSLLYHQTFRTIFTLDDEKTNLINILKKTEKLIADGEVSEADDDEIITSRTVITLLNLVKDAHPKGDEDISKTP